jgi:sensor histidine kinase regulating citrate/malate metabolism
MKELLNKLKSNILLQIIIPTIFLIGTILFFLSAFSLYQQKIIFVEELTKEIFSSGKKFIPSCEKALEDKNDLKLLRHINEITKNTNVSYSMVLNPEGKILAHSQLNHWGKIYQDSEIKQVLKSGKSVIHKNKKGIYIIFPLKKKNKLIGLLQIEATSLHINQKLKTIKKTIYITIFVSLLLIGLWLLIILKFTIITPLKNLKSAIEYFPLPKLLSLNQKSVGEFSCIRQKFNQIFKHFKEEQLFFKNQSVLHKENINLFLKNIGKTLNEGNLLLDSNNKIVFINNSACKILNLKKDNILNCHILDVFKNPDILKIINKALNNPNQIIKDFYSTNETHYNIKITMIKDKENNHIGGIILFYPLSPQ